MNLVQNEQFYWLASGVRLKRLIIFKTRQSWRNKSLQLEFPSKSEQFLAAAILWDLIYPTLKIKKSRLNDKRQNVVKTLTTFATFPNDSVLVTS